MIKIEVASQVFGRTLSCKYVSKISGEVCEFFTGYEELCSAIMGEYRAVLIALELLPHNSNVKVTGRNIMALSKGRNYKGRLTELVSAIMDIVEGKNLNISFEKAYYRKESDVVMALNKVEARLKDFLEEENKFFRGIPYKLMSSKVAV